MTSKGVIVQLDNDTAHVLKNDGSFVSCPRDFSWQIGDVITLPRRSRFISLKSLVISLAVILVLFAGTGFIVYQIPETYIELLVNPAVQITINRFDRVLSVNGLNTDGKNLIQDMTFKNLSFMEVYRRLLNRLDNNGYLNDAVVQFVVANDSQSKIADIEQNLREVFEQYGQNETLKVSIKRFEKNEYLELVHPIPIMTIPNESIVNIPDETQIEPPSTTETPTPQPSHGAHNYHNGNGWQQGDWRNGWWDWDCGMMGGQ